MLLHSIVFILGLGILTLGANWLVDGSSQIARKFGIRPLIIGLTIVALGTSLPEFLLNVIAVLRGEDGLAIGNIVGSNIANIGLILGISAILLPLVVDKGTLQREYPMMLAVTGLFYFLAFDGLISRVDGFILVSGLAAFIVYVVRDSLAHAKGENGAVPSDSEPNDSSDSRWKKLFTNPRTAPLMRIVLVLGGMAALILGARLMVDSALGIAAILGIAPIIIGLTVAAIGTSLPELAASLMSIFRKEADMAVGNILGSNMLNILFVVGVVALIQPMAVETESITDHFPIMILFSVLVWPLARRRHRLSRASGVFLLVGFVAYLAWLIIPLI
jgi:cation:H+ antiporter